MPPRSPSRPQTSWRWRWKRGGARELVLEQIWCRNTENVKNEKDIYNRKTLKILEVCSPCSTIYIPLQCQVTWLCQSQKTDPAADSNIKHVMFLPEVALHNDMPSLISMKRAAVQQVDVVVDCLWDANHCTLPTSPN